jgi:hypothetical protein
MVVLSGADPIIIDSETKVFLLLAIEIASLMFEAYCRISLDNKEMGVADPSGIVDLAAFIVTVIPFIFIPDKTPVIPPQVIVINLYPESGLQNAMILFFAKSSPTKKSKFLPMIKSLFKEAVPQVANEEQPTRAKFCNACPIS